MKLQMVRHQLSTFDGGRFVSLDVSSSTLLHTINTEGTHFIRISGFNRGRRDRKISFLFDNQETVFTTVKPTGNSQLLLPHIPIFNALGMTASAKIQHSTNAWTFPLDLTQMVNIDNGSVLAVVVLNVIATPDAQPVLLKVSDSRRDNNSAVAGLGREALIELYVENSTVAFEILDGGEGLHGSFLKVDLLTGIFLFGDVFVE